MGEVEERIIIVPDDTPPVRLDRYLADHPGLNLTRSRIQKLIQDDLVTVNGRPALKRYEVVEGDTIVLAIPPPEPSHIEAEDIPLAIVFEDDHLAIADKPAGMVTHPGAGNRSGTLVNALMYHFDQLAGGSSAERPGIVHRLDKNTSGLLLVAKSDEAYQRLQKMLQAREIHRTYLALVCGHVREDAGTIEAPIGRSPHDRKKMTVEGVNARDAVTHYTLNMRFRSYDLLDVKLETGRTHQIRVHFAQAGHPVFGDPDYGGREKWHRGIFGSERPLAKRLLGLMPRQALHARALEFVHPFTGKPVAVASEVPRDFASLLEILKEEGI